MALKATIFKAELQIADMDRGYYKTHAVTTARHPSENNERMMVRLLAFALNASDDLQFTRGLSTDDEPDIWEKDLVGSVQTWIEVGLPDERRIRKGCNQSEKMVIYAYGDRSAPVWKEQNKAVLKRFDYLQVIFLPEAEVEAMADMVERTMDLQFTVQDEVIMLSSSAGTVDIHPQIWK
ncbi:YaeQ family protein [Parendozoicomonas haliclonae]|uniref:YaeQ protein n=1 Tax=Parendozoicomonas haliclonae TaxID=1960125 RepID=A0A1X7AJZ3_9GAMM|nr:YaeQ family protein [Parendozoicomonas haliclonae]SMA46593.1 YaeQ protein [Parendozoicomonas haliclonae]